MRLRIKEFQVKRFYEKKLRKRVFDIIRENYEAARHEKLVIQKAELFDTMWVKRRFFSDWTDKLESRNEMKSMHVAYKARRHRERHLMNSCLRQWVTFIVEQRKEAVKENRADEFHRKNLLKHYTQRLVYYVELTKYKRANYSQALEFERTTAYAKFFHLWVTNYETTIESQMNTRIVINQILIYNCQF
jgi:hypothetical protein